MHCVSFVPPASNILLAGDASGKVIAWDWEIYRETFSVQASDEAVLAVRALSPDRFVTQSRDGAVKLWCTERPEANSLAGVQIVNAEITEELHGFCKCVVMHDIWQDGPTEPVIALPKGKDGATLWDPREPGVKGITFRAQAGGAEGAGRGGHSAQSASGQCMALSALSERYLAGGFEDGCVRLWDCRAAGAPLTALKAHDEPIFGLCATSVDAGAAPLRKGLVLSAGPDPWVAVSHLRDGADHTAAAAGGDLGAADELPREWELRAREKLPIKGSGKRGVNYIAARRDKKIFACGCWDGKVRVFACRKPRQLASLKWHAKGVQCVEFSGDGAWLVSASDDGQIAFWQVYQ